MRRLLITLAGGLVALAIGVLITLFVLLSGVDLKGRAAAAIEAATGRDVVVRGPAGFTLFPTLGVRARDVSIGNAPGGRAAHMIEAKEVNVGVAVAPLMRHRLEVTELNLVEPTFALEILPNGQPNWVLKLQEPPIKARVDEVSLSGVKIAKGRISFYNALTHLAYELTAVDATVDLAGLDKPLSLKGAATYNGEPTEVGASLSTPRLLLAGKPVGLALNLQSAPLMLRFEGVMQPGTSGVEGALTANGPDLRRLAAWGGNPIGEGENLKPFSVKGKFTYANHATAFNNAAVTLDAVSGRGDIVIETSSRKPLITGRLELAALDLNPYLSRVSAAPAPPSAAAPAVSAVPPKASGLQPVDVRKVGYDETPLDYTGLRDFNVSLDLTTGVLQVQKLRIDRAQLNVQLIDGFLAASINTMELYGGKGQAKVRIDARAEPLRFEETLDVDGVRTLSFLSDALGFGNLDSTANLTLAMKAEGRSQADLIKTLSGSGAFYFADGAFKGVDFGGVTRTVKNVISGRIAGKDAQTPFTNFAATVQIAHGVVATRDFKLNGPRLLVNALGVIDMGGQSLDLRFTPRTVFSRKQSGEAKVTGLPLPVRAIGPWTALKYKLDVTGSGKREEERDICAVIKSAECR